MRSSHKSFTSNSRARLFFYFLIFMFAGGGPFVSFVQAQQSQSPCENVVTEAQKLYDDGHFTPAISLLRLCLPDGVPEEQRVGAYRLLAHAYLAEDKSEEAKEAITKIFGERRDYTCDQTLDTQPYCELVEEVKANIPVSTWEKLTGGWKKWLWYGGAAIGAGTAVYLAQQKSQEESPLPEPPPLP